MRSMMIVYTLLYLLAYGISTVSASPDLLLAKTVTDNIEIDRYWVSEKLDGVRAYWNGQQFVSKQGNIFHAPPWFVHGFPNIPLDGELWSGRQRFERVVSTVRKKTPIDNEWREMAFYVFELPYGQGSFSDRIKKINHLVQEAESPYLQAVKQYKIHTKQKLDEELKRITELGGEGLMLHLAESSYITGRSDDLLKVKQHKDAEAEVIDHISGKGKYIGMLGSLVVETSEGVRFKIGTGFSDIERQNPPPIGSIITFRYRGLTHKGIPKFASFLRRRILVEK